MLLKKNKTKTDNNKLFFLWINNLYFKLDFSQKLQWKPRQFRIWLKHNNVDEQTKQQMDLNL